MLEKTALLTHVAHLVQENAALKGELAAVRAGVPYVPGSCAPLSHTRAMQRCWLLLKETHGTATDLHPTPCAVQNACMWGAGWDSGCAQVQGWP